MYSTSTLEICIISASNPSLIFDDADVFVVARLISGADEHTSPESTILNFPIRFAIPNLTATNNQLFVYLQLRSYEEEIGEVYIPVDHLLEFEAHESSQFVTYKIRDQSGVPIGEINLSYKLMSDRDRHPTPSAPPLPPPDPPPRQVAGRGGGWEFPVKVAVVVAAAFVGPRIGELLVKLQELMVEFIALGLAFLVVVGFLISLPHLLQRLATQRGGASSAYSG